MSGQLGGSNGPERPTVPGMREACAPYLSPYRTAIDRLGSCFEALLWNSPETQRLRFDAISSLIDLSGRVVLDAGCGRADLALWMREKKVHWRRYVGVDAIGEMVAHGRSLDLPHAEFFHADFIADERAFLCAGEPPDVVVFSGSLNTIPRTLAARALERAWRSCRAALVFNFLSSGDTANPPGAIAGCAQKFSPPAVLRWALRRTQDCAMRHDYLEGRDATVVMFKSGARARE